MKRKIVYQTVYNEDLALKCKVSTGSSDMTLLVLAHRQVKPLFYLMFAEGDNVGHSVRLGKI